MRSGQSQWITHRENRLFRGHDEFFVTNLHQRCWKLAHLLCKIREFILGRVLVFFKEEGTCVLIGHVATKYISIIRSADDKIREEDIILYSKSKILNRSMLNEDKLMIRLITNKVYSSSETKTLKKLHSFIANIEWEILADEKRVSRLSIGTGNNLLMNTCLFHGTTAVGLAFLAMKHSWKWNNRFLKPFAKYFDPKKNESDFDRLSFFYIYMFSNHTSMRVYIANYIYEARSKLVQKVE